MIFESHAHYDDSKFDDDRGRIVIHYAGKRD